MKTYSITLTGVSDLLMHRDNYKWSARVKSWSKEPENKARSVPGDDRTPAWTWLGYTYDNAGQLVIDADNLMAMLRDAGKKCPAATGRGSMKALTQSGLMVNEIGWPILIGGAPVNIGAMHEALQDELDFEVHEKAAEDAGFTLFVKRAAIGNSKHLRVRPRISNWSATGTITILDESIKRDVLKTILQVGGAMIGLMDWRPGGKTPGQFGRFEAAIEEVK